MGYNHFMIDEKTLEQTELEILQAENSAIKQELQVKNKVLTKYVAALQGIMNMIQAISD